MGKNMKEIRARIRTVDSTGHITRAMQLVASSKIRRVELKMEQSRSYRRLMQEALSLLQEEDCPYFRQRSRALPAAYVIVAGDRGLAGGYNSNIFRSAMAMVRKEDYILPIGKRATEAYGGRSRVLSGDFASAEHFSLSDSEKAAGLLQTLYEAGTVGAVQLIYTRFVSMLSQKPDMTHLLPPERGELNQKNKMRAVIEYEPGREEVFKAFVPAYLSGVLYACVTESFASELAARRFAMDTATKNADAMREELRLQYNRARQGTITRELSEIVAGSGILGSL